MRPMLSLCRRTCVTRAYRGGLPLRLSFTPLSFCVFCTAIRQNNADLQGFFRSRSGIALRLRSKKRCHPDRSLASGTWHRNFHASRARRSGRTSNNCLGIYSALLLCQSSNRHPELGGSSRCARSSTAAAIVPRASRFPFADS